MLTTVSHIGVAEGKPTTVQPAFRQPARAANLQCAHHNQGHYPPPPQADVHPRRVHRLPRNDHAALFTSLPVVKQTVRRYVQLHALDVEIAGLPASNYDGITELWFDDVEGFGRCFSDAEYLRLVRPDELKLFVLSATEILITEETVVLE